MNEALTQRILEFRDERDWKQFHSPKNLAMSIAIEAAELMEVFQWTPEQDSHEKALEHRKRVEEELADISIYVALMSHDLDIDLDGAVQRKLETNRRKYPVEKFRGVSTKYSE